MHHPSKVAKKGGYERHGVQDSQHKKPSEASCLLL
jgi:hypothetical protein